MKRSIKCLFKLHEYEVYKEENLYNVKDEIIGKVIINRCKHCGKIKSVKIITNDYYNH